MNFRHLFFVYRFLIKGRKVWVCLLFSLILAFPLRIVLAHGGGVPQIVNAETGPYLVSVWTQSNPLYVGQNHFTVAVSEPSDTSSSTREAGPPILEAKVELQLTPPEGKSLLVPATHKNAINKLFYEADLELPTIGIWQVEIIVVGPDGSGQTNFEVEVLPPSKITWILWSGLIVLLAAVAWFMMRRGSLDHDQ